MKRFCAHCNREFSREEFVKEETQGMEADRKTSGLEGVRFLYYRCPDCGFDDIFLDVLALPGESAEEFQKRREALEEAARRIHAENVEIVLVERSPVR